VNLFVFGLGYSAMHYVTTRAASEWVAGTVRTAEKAQSVREAHSIEALVFGAPPIDPPIQDRVASATHLLMSIPPEELGDPVLAHFAETIGSAPHLDRIVYLSTIGVYGDANGALIDEDAPAEPKSARNGARVLAEQQWIALADRIGKKITILRLAGIYGPGRNALVNLREGKARRVVKPGQVFNRIHVEDIARTIDHAAELLGIGPPPEIPFENADLTPMARSFYSSNKRVSNQRLKEQLGVTLTYPTYREGLRALVAEFEPAAH
jgi:hypothetical protein